MAVRRFISLLLALIMMLCVGTAFADGLDLAAMSLDELMELRSTIDLEIRSRVSELTSSPIGSGVYIGGRDIKVGSYNLSAKATDGAANMRVRLVVYASLEDYEESGGYIQYSSFTEPTQDAHFYIDEGYVLTLDVDQATCTVSAETAIWAQ